MGNVILETERLYLHTPQEDFAPLVLDYLQRNEEHFRAWSPIPDEGFFTLEFQKRVLNLKLQLEKEGKEIRFYLFDKHHNKRIIGDIGFSNIIRGAFLSCHLGYKIDKDERGKGLIGEAISAGINYMFTVLGLHRIEANIIPSNRASIRVVEKLGFENEGYSRHYLKINGIWQDHIHYVKLNEEM